MLKLEKVSKIYRMGDTEVHALREVSLEIHEGDFVAIMGPSGSGKSTLMNLLGLLDTPDSGTFVLNGRNVAGLSEESLAELRLREIGFIFQQFNLLPRLTTVENVAMPQLYAGGRPDVKRATELLTAVGLESRLGHKTNELSGGQQQRVAIARSLVNRPKILLADEPTGNLDSASEKEILSILKKLNSEGITIIVVTHEEEIGKEASRRIRMRDGQIQTDERLTPFPLKVVSAAPAPAPVEAPARGQALRRFLEHSRQGIAALFTNKVRAFLSMLGILIGVAAVIAMLAIGQGAREAVEAQLASLGSDLLVLKPGPAKVRGISQETGAANALNLEDATVILEKLPVEEVSPAVADRGQVVYANQNMNARVLGTGAAYADLHNLAPAKGRFFRHDEDQMRSRLVILGSTLAANLFGRQEPLGEILRINKVAFQVIGVLPYKGNRDQDNLAIIPVQTAMRRLMGKKSLDFIDIRASRAADMGLLQESVESLMLARHRVPLAHSEEAFEVGNMADVQAALSESSRTLSFLLASIAIISLLVGGIGIMNIMLVSVTERTREIGLRKAVGAGPKDILHQFLIESVVIGLAGGILGIALGGIATVLIASTLGWATSISPWAVALAFTFSAGVGVCFGIYPARKAASLNPIEALRYD